MTKAKDKKKTTKETMPADPQTATIVYCTYGVIFSVVETREEVQKLIEPLTDVDWITLASWRGTGPDSAPARKPVSVRVGQIIAIGE